MIRNIVFDLGNVLIDFSPIDYLTKFYDSDTVQSVYKAIFCSDNWQKLDRGTMTVEEATDIFCMKSPKYHLEIKEVMNNWYDMLTPKEDSVNILKELKEKGYNIYVLSNYHMKAFEITSKNNDFFNIINGKVVSYEINMLKPEREIYEHLLNKFNLIAEETLFVDDVLENIKGAEEAGIKTIQFVGAKELKDSLREYKVL